MVFSILFSLFIFFPGIKKKLAIAGHRSKIRFKRVSIFHIISLDLELPSTLQAGAGTHAD